MKTLRAAVAFVSLSALLPAISAVPGSPAPSPRPPAPASAPAARPPAPRRQPAQSDAAIESAIRAKFAKSKISADKFQVRVQGGIATLEGRTDVTQHKGVATRLAKTAGAAAVNNHIQISEAARAKAAANLEKGRRRAQIKRGEARLDAQPRQSK